MSRDALGSDPLADVDGDALLDLLPPRRRRTKEGRDKDDASPPSRPAASSKEPPPPAPPAEEPQDGEAGAEEVSTVTSARAKLTVDIPETVLDQARNAVYWTPGLTLVELVTAALRRELTHREKQRGRPFDQRLRDLTTGRPVR